MKRLETNDVLFNDNSGSSSTTSLLYRDFSAIVEKFYSSIGKNEVQPVGESEPSKDGQFRITSDELSNLRPRGGYSFSTG